jgi:8-hydroxy-5-deazaflavin:NADPH oxidoreductase
MNIGIVGAGNLGTGLAKRLVAKGHRLMLSFSRDFDKLKETAKTIGASGGRPAETAEFGDVLVLTVPYVVVGDALQQIGRVQAGKVLWDCTNPLKPDLSGLLVGTDTSGGEEIAKLAPWAKVVKAIPPFAEVLHSENVSFQGRKLGVFVCGDDADANEFVPDSSAILMQNRC